MKLFHDILFQGCMSTHAKDMEWSQKLVEREQIREILALGMWDQCYGCWELL